MRHLSYIAVGRRAVSVTLGADTAVVVLFFYYTFLLIQGIQRHHISYAMVYSKVF